MYMRRYVRTCVCVCVCVCVCGGGFVVLDQEHGLQYL